MAVGVILAGGYSRRMGRNKMVLDHGGKPLIAHCIETMRPFVDSIIVVSGRYHDAIADVLQTFPDVRVIHNPEYPKGMFSSVKAGLQVVDDDVFLIPGDMPLVKPSTYLALLDHADSLMAVPAYEGRRGHPIYIRHNLINDLLNESDASNLKRFRDSVGFTTVPVDDKGVLIDIDTLKDYNNLDHQ